MTVGLQWQWRSRPRTTWRRKAEKEREIAGWRSWREVFTAVAERTG